MRTSVSTTGFGIRYHHKKTEKAKLKPEKSTFLALPTELWDEPVLLSNCLNSVEILKFNPFIPGESILFTDKLNEQLDSQKKM